MKYGIKIKLDVSKLDKDQFFKGKKGTYVDLVTFVDVDNQDQYENNGFIKQDLGKDVDAPISGNVKVFWRQDGQAPQRTEPSPQSDADPFDDDSIPF